MLNLISILKGIGYNEFVGNYKGITSEHDISNNIEDLINYSTGLWVIGIKNFIYVEDLFKFISIADSFYKRYSIRFLGIIEKDNFIANKKLIEQYSIFTENILKNNRKAAIKRLVSKVEAKQGHGLFVLQEMENSNADKL